MTGAITISQEEEIVQVVSVRLMATLTGPSGNSYIAYAGPADWNVTGTVFASFPMPNVPSVNQVYTLNVSYSYTLAITQYEPSPSGSEGYGSWETYFYNAYSPVPYASQQITVVSGGVLVSTGGNFSQIETQIDGVWNTLNVSSSNLQNALSSGLKTINGNIVTIQTQGSEILANLTTINAQIKSINGNMATITTDIGTINTTLSSINAQIKSINGNMATITTDIGTINTTLSSINAQITSIDNGIATIQTEAGTIQASLATLNAKLVAVNGTLATISTNVGTVQTSLSSINAQLTSVQGNVATVQTDLGTLTGTVDSVNGTVATINTKIGTLQASINGVTGSINSAKSGISNTIIFEVVILALVLITLVAAIVSVIYVNKAIRKIDEIKKP
ncbi:hypothetical protein Osc2_29760 [Ruminococcus sp. 25CYCFAH16]